MHDEFVLPTVKTVASELGTTDDVVLIIDSTAMSMALLLDLINTNNCLSNR